MQPLGQALGGLDAEAVDEELLGELAVRLQLGHQLGDLVADGHGLQCDDVELAALLRAEEVARQTWSLPGWRGLTKRCRIVSRSLGVEHDDVIAFAVAGEVPQQRARVQVGLLAPHALQARAEALVLVGALQQLPPGVALDALAAPVQLEEHVGVEVRVDLVEVDRDLAHAPERGLGDRDVGRRGGALGAGRVEQTSISSPFSRKASASAFSLASSSARGSSSTILSITWRPSKASLQ